MFVTVDAALNIFHHSLPFYMIDPYIFHIIMQQNSTEEYKTDGFRIQPHDHDHLFNIQVTLFTLSQTTFANRILSSLPSEFK